MTNTGGIAGDSLRSLASRVNNLEEEKKGIAADIKEVYGEAKALGFDTKIMKKAMKTVAMDKAARDEEEALLDIYIFALEGAAEGQENKKPQTS